MHKPRQFSQPKYPDHITMRGHYLSYQLSERNLHWMHRQLGTEIPGLYGYPLHI